MSRQLSPAEFCAEAPKVEIPLHTLIKITWDGWRNIKEERITMADSTPDLQQDGQRGQTETGGQTHRFAFLQPKYSRKQRERSGKQREATRNNGKLLRID